MPCLLCLLFVALCCSLLLFVALGRKMVKFFTRLISNTAQMSGLPCADLGPWSDFVLNFSLCTGDDECWRVMTSFWVHVAIFGFLNRPWRPDGLYCERIFGNRRPDTRCFPCLADHAHWNFFFKHVMARVLGLCKDLQAKRQDRLHWTSLVQHLVHESNSCDLLCSPGSKIVHVHDCLRSMQLHEVAEQRSGLSFCRPAAHVWFSGNGGLPDLCLCFSSFCYEFLYMEGSKKL